MAGGALHIREDNREENQTVKTETSVRTIPLHDEIIRQGFIEYVHSLPSGPMFRQYRTNKYNRRNDHASKVNSEFVRNLGITDRRKAPMHSWRHFAWIGQRRPAVWSIRVASDGRSHRPLAKSIAARASARYRIMAAHLAGEVQSPLAKVVPGRQ